MQNVDMKIEGTTLVIRVDLAKRLGPSKSGKTEIIGTTSGNASLQGGAVKVGLNVYAPRA